jgi:hypothetical protein
VENQGAENDNSPDTVPKNTKKITDNRSDE